MCWYSRGAITLSIYIWAFTFLNGQELTKTIFIECARNSEFWAKSVLCVHYIHCPALIRYAYKDEYMKGLGWGAKHNKINSRIMNNCLNGLIYHSLVLIICPLQFDTQIYSFFWGIDCIQLTQLTINCLTWATVKSDQPNKSRIIQTNQF